MEKIKIGIGGTHSTGKTTFIKRLSTALTEKSVDHQIIGDLASKCPLPILRDHTVESTLWIASQGINLEIEAGHKHKVVIADRPILDCWAYFNAVCKGQYPETNPKLQTLKSMILNWLPTYDLLYQTVVNENIPIEDNKGRDLDIVYRRRVADEMTAGSVLFNASPKLLTYENTDQELQFILDQIEGAIGKS
ncbi:MAG: hypothetical protein JWO03_3937 [Bacteroidetes bacterium]|nr:hypothetical protein [Bacteroidota bacterium]